MITLTSHTHTHTHTHTHRASAFSLSLYAVVDKAGIVPHSAEEPLVEGCVSREQGGRLSSAHHAIDPWHRLTRPNAETRRHGRNLVCEITQTWPVNSNNEQRAHTNAHSCHTGLCVNAQWKTNQPSDINSLMWNTQNHTQAHVVNLFRSSS